MLSQAPLRLRACPRSPEAQATTRPPCSALVCNQLSRPCADCEVRLAAVGKGQAPLPGGPAWQTIARARAAGSQPLETSLEHGLPAPWPAGLAEESTRIQPITWS